ncbi:hydrolase [Aliidiomarina maris]|uniref:Hydrolase n=1 Tax=Aliidiomarina maris TaxID=531312 RepID=A0A327WVP3_9GAMM|nr:hydrolase [Aliidiomarina maris]MCL5050827.1 hydrolase [Bacillota bacterium]RAJ96973.1 isochorismate hydrolase [Aliidiomarina maris]RUO24584.1 hydrolase [Aliidiomarina maris]
MRLNSLIQRDQSVLCVVDVQQRLAPAIVNVAALIERHQWLLAIANQLLVPVVYTEQYPQGLGPTVNELNGLLASAQKLEKTHFSAYAEQHVREYFSQTKRQQIVLTGTETHVCVLQTALDMQAQGFKVFVVEDAVGSRRESDKRLALQRLRDNGCQIVSSEMVAFEWLHRSATDEFKHISRNFLR